jgi:hypothetical protein
MTKQQTRQREVVFTALEARRGAVETQIAELSAELDQLDEAYNVVREKLR